MNLGGMVLIVDDDPAGQETLAGLLASQGYELLFASNGAEALAQAGQFNPDLILLDVMMPGMDGFEVCRNLRANPTLVDIPVVIVTGLDDQESRLNGFEAGADDFISKPFDWIELRTRVRTITRLNRQRRLHTLELQAERDRTRAILEALGEAVVVTDPAGLIKYVNPATLMLTGFSSKDLIGKNWRIWQSHWQPANFYDRVAAIVMMGRTWQSEVIHKRKDGAFYEAMLTVAPLFEPADQRQPVGFVSVQRDITPLKEAERLKDRFVSNVSHELSTPLSVITLLADNLDNLYERLDEAQHRKLIQDIQKHAEILNNLVDGVLAMSRLDSQRVSMEREMVNLAQLAADEVEKQLPLSLDKAQRLHIDEGDPLWVWANDGQLRQVIRNLVNNGIKYTPNAGQVTCECVCLAVNEPAGDLAGWPGSSRLEPGKWAALRVSDTGLGIAQNDLPHVFERFYRVKSQGNIRGTGLGLAIVRELVELHAGYIGAASQVGQGSTFAIYLPVVKEQG